MDTPLYSSLEEFRKKSPLRLHIPGHKGKESFFPPHFLALDFTELSSTGNLYEGGEPFDTAQQQWANQFGFSHAQFLTGGSTQGIYSALALVTKAGQRVLLDRGAHRSAVHAMGLLRLKPVYLPRPWLTELEVPGHFDPDEIGKMMDENPDIKVVFITSPTYCGILSDVYSIADQVHQRGGKLVVDGAHGAHLPWLMIDNYSAADLVTISVHKTLPALGQASILLYRDILPEIVREKVALFGTSSPSYPILASIDLARAWMEEDGMMEYVRVARMVATMREIFPSLSEPLALDPTRLTILCNEGQQVARELEKLGVYIEMANTGHLVAVFTGMDSDEEMYRFSKALIPHFAHRSTLPDLRPPEKLPKKRLEVYEVMSMPKEILPLSQCLGRIAGISLAPYPPGVPVVVMGEEITQASLDYFEKIGFTKEDVLVVEDT